MLKKILLTSLLSASIIGVNAGVSEASAPDQQQPQVYVYAQAQGGQGDAQELLNNCFNKLNSQLDPAIQNKIQELLKQVTGQLQQQEEAPNKAEEPKKEESEKKADKPKKEKPNKKAEQPAPAPEEKADPAPAPEKQPEPEQKPAPTPASQQPKEQQPAEQPAPENNTEAGFTLTADEQQMVDLVNKARQQAGLAPLKVDPELTKVARLKAKDMIQNNYFSHNSPTYGSPFDMMNQFGIEYRTAGENIAGNSSVQGAHTSLMNSDGHRKNILGSQYTEVGIGIVDGGQYGKMFVQMFKG
ncbi:CAP domain-containing protein [Alkalihalobacillus sp. AL-G]|uniref:CAP domain-containing protein n=1 Tax=Alkalihalobacillus sp. AL-G TaxID=2926399 RepID=UPI00272CEAB7|nr:CAP domain-containing protein [Alkalihalobacillus sp. AL-G]WLD94162.1 CAP domain-containing protein [Alkalihalobacillus sp. AL-G]